MGVDRPFRRAGAANTRIYAVLSRSAKFFQPEPKKTKQNQTKPRKTKKKPLGFPWIPSSETGLFKGLRRFQRKKIHRLLSLITKTERYIRPHATNAWPRPSEWSNRRSPRSPRESKDATFFDFQQRIVRKNFLALNTSYLFRGLCPSPRDPCADACDQGSVFIAAKHGFRRRGPRGLSTPGDSRRSQARRSRSASSPRSRAPEPRRRRGVTTVGAKITLGSCCGRNLINPSFLTSTAVAGRAVEARWPGRRLELRKRAGRWAPRRRPIAPGNSAIRRCRGPAPRHWRRGGAGTASDGPGRA